MTTKERVIDDLRAITVNGKSVLDIDMIDHILRLASLRDYFIPTSLEARVEELERKVSQLI